MGQKYYANPRDSFTFPCGAIGYRPGGPMDCIGYFAKVVNCRVDGLSHRYTCYATREADSYISVPACTRVHNRHISGFFANDKDGLVFYPDQKHKDFIREARCKQDLRDLKSLVVANAPIGTAEVIF